jgi:hypothetical protein
VVETRCTHGFLRSAVPCPVCDPGRTRVERETSECSRPAGRVRGQGEVITREGSFRCRDCGELKPLQQFYVSRSMKRGHQSMCKACDNNKRVERLRASTHG